MRKIREWIDKIRGVRRYAGIQFTIAVSFTVVAVVCMALIGMILYYKMVSKTEETTIEAAEQLLNQTSVNLETYLRNMMRISDSMYYSVIKDKDMSNDNIDAEMNLLYEANKDNLVSIACFTEEGELVGATPVAVIKEGVDVTGQEWFQAANEKMENLHFSIPHVQDLFDDISYRYYWVVSLSRMVELTDSGKNVRGVLLVDMNFSGIEQLFKKSNAMGESGYIYLTDNSGKIIYHPRHKLINSGVVKENNLVAAAYEDGSRREVFEGERRIVTVKTVGYTGWKIVSVMPYSAYAMNMNQMKYFVVIIITVTVCILFFVNQMVSARIAEPIKKLNDSVKGLENGNLDVVIYEGGGSEEIQHLGRTLNSVVVQLRKLMDEVVVEQEEKRKTELDALQSQINPHFLYNTLDSIVWMIEGEKYDEAIRMVTDLASLFRISLSKGKTIITIQDEILHAQNYMNIQQIRYKEKFSVAYDIDPSVGLYCTVKLVVQPLLENAIYYGMEYMDGEGEILVRGYWKEGDIYIDVTDNGPGMTEDVVNSLLIDNNRVRKKGSGVGLINVHKRIQLHFGKEYGLEIESQPDEGTTVRIHLPALKYEDWPGEEKNEA